VLGLRNGHLVYARGNQEPARHVVRQSGIRIYCHAIDLDQESGPMMARMRELADLIAGTRISATPVHV
jgi:5-methylcytosine-specific restriction enzyme subunit McrC